MDRRAWQTTVHRVARAGHHLASEPPPSFCLKPHFTEMTGLINSLLQLVPVMNKVAINIHVQGTGFCLFFYILSHTVPSTPMALSWF